MSLPFKNKSIQALWTEFQTQVMPPDAPAIQVTEMRKAFLAGFATLLVINERIGEPDVNEDDACTYLSQLRDELHEEMRKLKQ